MVEQQLRRRVLAGEECRLKRSVAELRLRAGVHIGAAVDEELRRRDVAGECRDVQGSPTERRALGDAARVLLQERVELLGRPECGDLEEAELRLARQYRLKNLVRLRIEEDFLALRYGEHGDERHRDA